MSTISAPNGLTPVLSKTGEVRSEALVNGIASGYTGTIYQGDPIVINTTDGTVNISAAGAGQYADGVFAGCFYEDAAGIAHDSPNWIGGTTYTRLTAYVYTDPNIVYEVQGDGPVPQAKLGHEAILNVGTGSALSGRSTASLATAGFLALGTPGAVKVVGFSKAVGNVPGDAYTRVRVVLSQPKAFAPGVVG